MQMRKFVVGLTTYLENAKWSSWDTRASVIQESYLKTVFKAECLPILIPPPLAEDEIDPYIQRVLEIVDGVIVIGGSDIDPSLYGEQKDKRTMRSNIYRDRYELKLAKTCYDEKKPFLGICRGLQIMNVALGGTLNQHIKDDATKDNHVPEVGDFQPTSIETVKTTLVSTLYGNKAEVTCRHHQAINRLGNFLKVSAYAADSTVEAVEAQPFDRFFLGLQWHPEGKEDEKAIKAMANFPV